MSQPYEQSAVAEVGQLLAGLGGDVPAQVPQWEYAQLLFSRDLTAEKWVTRLWFQGPTGQSAELPRPDAGLALNALGSLGWEMVGPPEVVNASLKNTTPPEHDLSERGVGGKAVLAAPPGPVGRWRACGGRRMSNPPGHWPGYHLPGTTVPIGQYLAQQQAAQLQATQAASDHASDISDDLLLLLA